MWNDPWTVPKISDTSWSLFTNATAPLSLPTILAPTRAYPPKDCPELTSTPKSDLKLAPASKTSKFNVLVVCVYPVVDNRSFTS